METNTNNVTVVVTSQEGHTEFSLTSKDALAKVIEIHNNQGKWAYLGSSVVSPSRLTEDMLQEHKVVVMADALVGGQGSEMIIDLHIAPFQNEDKSSAVEAVDPESKFVVTMEYVPQNVEKFRLEPALRVWVNQEFFTEVAHQRELIFKGALAKLNEFMNLELAKYRNTYKV